jgi:hypothetical protein
MNFGGAITRTLKAERSGINKTTQKTEARNPSEQSGENSVRSVPMGIADSLMLWSFPLISLRV